MRKSFSAFGTSSCKHLSAVRGRHSFSEAMLHFSLALFRLVCSFHSDQSFPLISYCFTVYAANSSFFFVLFSGKGYFANIALLLYRIYKPVSRVYPQFFLSFYPIFQKNLINSLDIFILSPPLSLSFPLSARSFCRCSLSLYPHICCKEALSPPLSPPNPRLCGRQCPLS